MQRMPCSHPNVIWQSKDGKQIEWMCHDCGTQFEPRPDLPQLQCIKANELNNIIVEEMIQKDLGGAKVKVARLERLAYFLLNTDISTQDVEEEWTIDHKHKRIIHTTSNEQECPHCEGMHKLNDCQHFNRPGYPVIKLMK